MTDSAFWEDLSYSLLEMNLNGDSMNSQILKRMFKSKPEVLAQMDFGEGVGVEQLDKHMYGRPDVVEIREAKPHELW